MNRRSMMKTVGSVAGVLIADAVGVQGSLLGQTAPRGRTFDPRQHGARGDGATLDTQAMQAAIDACTLAGGGTVLVQGGTYVVGTITLKSNVTLEVAAEAMILGSPNPADYVMPPEGVKAIRHPGEKRMIFAINAENVSIVGPGTIDGNNKAYLVPTQRAVPRPQDEYRDIAAFGTHRTAGISPMIQFANCTNVLVQNILLQNADGWTLSPTGCHKVVIRKVTVRNAIDASNTDGIDPRACVDVLITDCDIVTGDDGICVKSGNPYFGEQECRDVKVVNCRVSSCTNALRVGVEGPAPFSNISFTDCQIYAVKGPVNTSPAAGICMIMQDGRSIDGVSFTNITMTGVRVPIFVRLQTSQRALQVRQASGAPITGTLQNISFSGIRATGAIFTSSITGIGDLPIKNVSLTDIDIQTAEPGQLAWTQPPVKEAETGYAGPFMFGRVPAYGLYLRHIDGLTMKNVNIRSEVRDPRPMLSAEDIANMMVQNVSGTPGDPSQPLLDLRDLKGSKIIGNRAPAGTEIFARISGANTHDVQFQGNDLTQSKRPVGKTAEVPEDAVGPVR